MANNHLKLRSLSTVQWSIENTDGGIIDWSPFSTKTLSLKFKKLPKVPIDTPMFLSIAYDNKSPLVLAKGPLLAPLKALMEGIKIPVSNASKEWYRLYVKEVEQERLFVLNMIVTQPEKI